MKNKKLTAVLSVLMAAAVLFTGCGNKKSDVPTISYDQEAEDVFIGMPDAVEELPSEMNSVPTVPMFELYQGSLVLEDGRGTTQSGAPYAVPIIDEEALEVHDLYSNERIQKATLSRLNVVNGEEVYLLPSNCHMILNCFSTTQMPSMDDPIRPGVVIDLYTGETLSPIEYMHLTLRHFGKDLPAALKEIVEQEYTNMAMEDERYTPTGLARTLQEARWQYNDTIDLLDADGNPLYSYGFNEMDYRWMQHSLSSFEYNGMRLPYLDPQLDLPGSTTMKNSVAQVVQEFMDARGGTVPSIESDHWVGGRHLVLSMKLTHEETVEYHYFFLNLLTGLEESAEDVYATMNVDKTVLMQTAKPQIDADYQQKCVSITNKPFEWEHDEALYARTLSDENLSNARVIPHSSGLCICYDVYLPDSDAPVQTQMFVPTLEPTLLGLVGNAISKSQLNLYPGLENLFAKHFPIENNVGYANYGVWQYEDIIIIGMGFFDTDLNWSGCEAVCFNEGGGCPDLKDVLSDYGMDRETFDNEVRLYLESQPDFPG